MLLTAAILLVKSLERVNAIPTGFRVEDVVVARIALPTESPGSGANAVTLFTNRQERFRQFAERLAAMPNVQQVGIVDNLLIPGAADDEITVPGDASQSAISGQLKASSVTPGFFTTLDVQLKAGRFLASEDLARKIALFQPDAPLARRPPEPAVVNETFARRYFNGRGALGQRFCLGCPGKPYWYEVVGIVNDMRRQSLERAPVAEYFTLLFGTQTAELLIRTDDTPERYGPAIRAAVHGIDPGARVLEISTVDQKLGALSAERRFQTFLLSAMAALATMLAVGGVYGLARYGVVQRTREIGLRVALGARPEAVVRLVVQQGVRAPLIGLAAGVAGAAGATRVMTHALFQISPTDPFTLMQAALGMGAVILVACYLPARRAARIDPLIALRQ
jgi:predicted permease